MFGPIPVYDPLGDALPLGNNPGGTGNDNNNTIINNMMLDNPVMPPELMGDGDPAFDNINRAAL